MNPDKLKHPMQPVYLDEQGTARFKENRIIRWLCDSGKIDLNQLAIMDFSKEDHMQLAQLLGYSVAGFGELCYASPAVVEEADKQVDWVLRLNEMKKEIA